MGIVHDDGGIERECTLRAAIQEANAFPGADAINFGIPSTEDSNCVATTNVCTISPASQLPTITRPLNIRGYSQPEASANTATIGTNAELKIVLNGSRIESSADGLLVTARNTTVRGLVINNFRRFGVFFDQEIPSDAGRTLAGCFIGTDASGTQDNLGNGGGVVIDDGEGNVIGGTTLGARNLISGNNDTGVFVSEPANGNTIQGNLIGTDKNGTDSNLGNRTGMHIVGGSNNTIGGNGAGNTIAFNRFHGIQVQEVIDPNSGTGNSILSNSIFSNAGLGIQLGAEAGTGVTPNDGDNPATPQPDPDSDTGANRLQNFPIITSATTTIFDDAIISGRLNSTPEKTFTIQFFSTPAGNAALFGSDEGVTFLGETQVTTNRTAIAPSAS